MIFAIGAHMPSTYPQLGPIAQRWMDRYDSLANREAQEVPLTDLLELLGAAPHEEGHPIRITEPGNGGPLALQWVGEGGQVDAVGGAQVVFPPQLSGVVYAAN